MSNLALVRGDASTPASFNPNDPACWQRQEAETIRGMLENSKATAAHYRDIEARAHEFAETWERTARTYEAALTQLSLVR